MEDKLGTKMRGGRDEWDKTNLINTSYITSIRSDRDVKNDSMIPNQDFKQDVWENKVGC